MARKGAATTTDGAERRRSSRIKDQAKPDPPPKKAPAKPRSRKPKATGEEADAAGKEKPKSAARGKKRTSAEKEAESAQPAVNGEDAPPPAKKVNLRPRAHITKINRTSRPNLILRLLLSLLQSPLLNHRPRLLRSPSLRPRRLKHLSSLLPRPQVLKQSQSPPLRLLPQKLERSPLPRLRGSLLRVQGVASLYRRSANLK